MHHALVFVQMCTVLRLAIQINSTALPGDQNPMATCSNILVVMNDFDVSADIMTYFRRLFPKISMYHSC